MVPFKGSNAFGPMQTGICSSVRFLRVVTTNYLLEYCIQIHPYAYTPVEESSL